MLKMLSLLFLSLAFTATMPLADEVRSEQRVEHDFGHDRFAAGREISVSQAVAGDLIAAGGQVTTTAKVGGDAVLAGGEVRMDGRITGSCEAPRPGHCMCLSAQARSAACIAGT